MGRQPTFPTLFDEVNILCLKFLNEHGYFDIEHYKTGTITWTSRNTGRKSSIGIRSIRKTAISHYIDLEYNYGKENRDCSIKIEFVPSNLGVGEIMYFVCPQTGQRCRKLHCIDGWFFHRSAFKGCYYDCQIVSKRFRQYTNALNLNREIDELYSKRFKKYRKTHYRGKKTKIVQQLDKQIALANYGSRMFETLLMM